jgi:hypothetical protein
MPPETIHNRNNHSLGKCSENLKYSLGKCSEIAIYSLGKCKPVKLKMNRNENVPKIGKNTAIVDAQSPGGIRSSPS